MDCAWYGAMPKNNPKDINGSPPGRGDHIEAHHYDTGYIMLYNMRRVCLDRHRGAINCTFADGSARKVKLPDLWTLR